MAFLHHIHWRPIKVTKCVCQLPIKFYHYCRYYERLSTLSTLDGAVHGSYGIE